MKTLLDGVPLHTEDDSLATALDAVRTHAGERLVIEVLADGLPIPPEDLESPPETAPYADEIEFRTASPGPLIAESLMQAADVLESVAPTHQQAAEQIQRGESGAALESLKELLAVWQNVQELLQVCAGVAGVNLATAAGGADVFDRATGALSQCLGAVRDGLEQQDWSELADVLSEDLGGLASDWVLLLRSMGRSLVGTGR